MPFSAICRTAWAAFLLAPALSMPAQVSPHSVAMEVIHGKPYVQVLVNGQGPFRFLVDTGTGGDALVGPQLADQLELPVVGQARLTDPTGMGEQRAPVVLLHTLRVAGVEFTRIKAVRHTLTADEGFCQGVLGFLLFKEYLLTLDYPNHRLSLDQGDLLPDGEKLVLPFRMPSGVPIVTLRLGTLRVEGQIDSGGAGLSLPERVAARLKFKADPAVIGNGHSLSTRFQVKAGRLAGDVRLGVYTFVRPIVETNPAFPIANFGSCPLQNFTVTFDQRNLLVRLSAAHRELHLDSTPTPIRLAQDPAMPPPPGLVPVG